jgi:iron complex outermembrane recepter protein
MKKTFILFVLLQQILFTKAQHLISDTSLLLSNITVKAFESNRKLLEIPATVSYISNKNLQRLAVTSLVPVFNTVPGVRMEERSPGSYRLSIRGSLLRSPFGVRNIKVYVDDIPFTDAGGNTYINLIDINTIQTAEIIKGPASSMYGAGTGGAVILNSTKINTAAEENANLPKIKLRLTGGSYGLFNQNLQWQKSKKTYGFALSQTHVQSDGYRENSRLRKDVVQFNGYKKISNKDELKFILLLADLYYKTPGGLTFAQWQAAPQNARLAAGALPSAVQQKAAIYNKTIFTGLTNTLQFLNKWSNTTSLVFNYTNFKNPFITNYEKRKEVSTGVTTKFIYNNTFAGMPVKFITGAEWQTTAAHINNYGNKSGVADTVQTKDIVNANQRFYFAQADMQVTHFLFITAGVSNNGSVYNYERTAGSNIAPQKIKKYTPVLSPRFAVLCKPVKAVSIRAAVSKGFSAPAIAELRPSEGSFFENLQPEYGWNYEAGLRAELFKKRLSIDIVLYQFNLQQAIVRRVATNGGEYFVNAGGTKQKGIEAFASYQILKNNTLGSLNIWLGFTGNNYHFNNYTVGTVNYSGNKITGVPGKVVVGGIDAEMGKRVYVNCTFNYTDKLALNDANTIFADSYRLLQTKIGYKCSIKKTGVELFAGADNILNEQYSLGNDINAVGARYYNAAPPCNFFAGIGLAW